MDSWKQGALVGITMAAIGVCGLVISQYATTVPHDGSGHGLDEPATFSEMRRWAPVESPDDPDSLRVVLSQPHVAEPGKVDLQLDEDGLIWGIVAGEGCVVSLLDVNDADLSVYVAPPAGRVWIWEDQHQHFMYAEPGEGCGTRVFGPGWSTP